MRVVAGLALLLANVFSRSCVDEEPIAICFNIPSALAFPPGFSSLTLIMMDVGEINSTALRSDNLASVTRLRIENAGVTGIAEGAFSSFQNLTELHLNQNLLTEIKPNWFGRPDILTKVSLTENQIEVLNETMLNGLVNLNSLSLNKNRIRTIDPNSFNSQTVLAELDLSENRLTWVSPQVFRSLRSTRIRLDGNPWDCSCGAEDFVDFIRDLQNRSLIDRQMEVTCESPPPLRGQPVWNVSVCVTSPPPRSPSVTETAQPKPTNILTTTVLSSAATSVVTTPPSRPTSRTETSAQPKPTDTLTTVPTSTVVTTPPSRPTSKTETSAQPKPTDTLTTVPTSVETTPPAQPSSSAQPKPTDAPFIFSSATPPTSEKRTSIQPKPTDNLTTTTTPTLKTEAYMTSQPSVMEISVHPKPSDLPINVSTTTAMTEIFLATPRPSDTNIVCTLVVVIVVLSLLLSVGCFLVVLHRGKRKNKTVMPGCPKQNREDSKEEGSGSSQAPCPEKRENHHWDSEVGWRTSFTGVRAKSADAILFTSPFSAPMKDQVTSQNETEAQMKDRENQTEGNQKVESETEVDGGFETEKATDTTENTKQAADGRNLDKDPYSVVNTDTVPYLSIGTSQKNPDDLNKQSTDGSGQRSQTRRVMGRISTWPPTAIQWQARCKMMQKEEGGSDVLTVWTPQFPSEVKKVSVEHPSGSVLDQKDKKTEKNQIEEPQKLKEGNTQSPKPNDKTISFSEVHDHTDMKQEEQLDKEEMSQDPATVRQTTGGETQNLSQEKPAEKNTSKRTIKAEPKRAVTSRQRPENRGTGSKAPSGGSTPDDETLLSGNEYPTMDLLHEVVQNNGRWTRERWRQIHVNKQRL